jgi:16S rRNA (cytosine967-C5)-methyltransferase
MISPARKVCFSLLSKIDARKAFSDDALNSESIRRLEVRDRHLTTEIVYGTLRWQALLDYVCAAASSRPWPDVEAGARILLRMSLYQMWRMDRVPVYAIVNDAVGLAKREFGNGVGGFVNGVLRRLARSHPWKNEKFPASAPEWIQVSLPEWLWNRWVSRFGRDAAKRFALSLNEAPRAAFRVSALRAGLETEIPAEATPSEIVPGAFLRTAHRDAAEPEGPTSPGLQFQDEASQLIPHLLRPLPGWRVWDTCAAPGGKAAILGQACGNSGRVIASDIRFERIARMIRLLNGSGLSNVDPVVADAGRPAPFHHPFDAVIADVPCSGLGTLRRNPEIKWNFSPEKLPLLHKNQASILLNAAAAVRVGGRLLYSTCSTEPEENEDVVATFLKVHPDFSLERPEYPEGIAKWVGLDSMVRTFPADCLWDGFFAALMVRKS